MKPQLILFLLLSCLGVAAQPEINSKKYPSLLWEISKPGQKKPSYLIGTMHVSNKMAFNLPDSFYHAIRSANVVALETNPETWQEDMSRYDIGNSTYGSAGSLYGAYSAIPADYLGINTLKFYRYNRKIEEPYTAILLLLITCFIVLMEMNPAILKKIVTWICIFSNAGKNGVKK